MPSSSSPPDLWTPGPKLRPRATFWHQETLGTTYYRCTLPARHLPGVSQPFLPTDIVEDAEGTVYFPRQRGDVAIWQFVGASARAIPMAVQQEQGLRVLMETDDDYLRPAPHADQPGQGWQEGFDDPGKQSHDAHRKIATWVDGMIVSTPALADAYRELNENVWVCPNAIDPADWPEPQPYDGTLRIGWSASMSHARDARLVRRALLWASKQPKVEVVLYGLKPEGWNFRFKHVPWTDDLADYRHNLTFLDVGLCPLLDSGWSRGRSDVKALEYAVAGALPIVSRVESYRPWWEGRLPCLAAESAGGFEEALRWCVLHRDEVQELAAAAREHVLRERSFPRAIEPWRDAVAAVSAPSLAVEGVA